MSGSPSLSRWRWRSPWRWRWRWLSPWPWPWPSLSLSPSHVAVAVAVAVAVGVASPSTYTVPVMKECWPQTNAYVPTALNRHEPVHGGSLGSVGNGAGPGELPPSVHEVGCADSNSTLWELLPFA